MRSTRVERLSWAICARTTEPRVTRPMRAMVLGCVTAGCNDRPHSAELLLRTSPITQRLKTLLPHLRVARALRQPAKEGLSLAVWPPA